MKRIFLSPPHQTGSEIEWIQKVMDSNYLAPVGDMLDQLESELCTITGMPYCLAVNSGTAALHLALHHLKDQASLRSSQPPVVIAASLTFVASIAPAIHLGYEVWLCDAEMESWTLDPTCLSLAFDTARKENRDVLCVIPTDLYGQSCNLAALHSLCDPLGIPVLCDSAESLGVTQSGPQPQHQIFSFNGNKIITCSAGGLLASQDEHLIAHARKLASQAREPAVHYEHKEVGYNFRLSNLLAAVALAQLETLEERVQKRRQNFAGYHQRLGDLDGISFMPEAEWNTATHWLSVIQINPSRFGATPEDIRLALEAENIESRPVWKPMHLQPAFQTLRTFGGACAESIYAQGLCLPSGHALTDRDLDRICGIIESCGM